MKEKQLNCIPPVYITPAHRLVLFISLAFTVWSWVVFCSGSVFAQTPVYVSASITGNNGLLIEDLTPEEVFILESEKPRRLAFMAREELPTAYGLIFDQDLLPRSPEEEATNRFGPPVLSAGAVAKSVAYGLTDKYLKQHAVWVASYGRELTVLLEATADGFKVKDVIQRMRSSGSTQESFLYSALFSALNKMAARNEKRRVLIVFLTNLDLETTTKIAPLKNLLASTNAELVLVSFAAGLGNAPPGRLPPSMSRGNLLELGRMTSGEAIFASEYGNHPEDLIRRLINHLRTLYTFGYESESPSGELSRLLVRTTRPGAKVKIRPYVPVRQ